MSKWTKQLRAYDDAISFEYDAFARENVIRTPSPYLNWIFGNKSGGFPKGSGILLFSSPKAGKSLISMSILAQIHMDDPEAEVIVFNTEMRGKFQNLNFFKGLDKDRVTVYNSSRPEDVFDRLEKDIIPMVQDGMPLRAIVIDSITSIGGVKSDGRSITEHTVGDKALTITKGWEKIMPLCKRYNISVIGVEQMRKNLDTFNPKAPKEKMAAIFSTRHNFEYFISIKKIGGSDGKQSLTGEVFVDEEIKDSKGNKDETGHQVSFKMEDSSFGVRGRTGYLTIDYKKGIINTHEEIFELGKNTGVIGFKMPRTYSYEGRVWTSKGDCAEAIKNDPDMGNRILEEVYAKDKKE